MERTHLEYLEEILDSQDACDHLTGYQKQTIDALAELLSFCPYERLCELAQADWEGRCVVLPCKIGAIVYSIRHERVPDDEYRMSFHTEMRIISQKFGLNHADCIGKTVFLTREEAEEALRREQDEKGGDSE